MFVSQGENMVAIRSFVEGRKKAEEAMKVPTSTARDGKRGEGTDQAGRLKRGSMVCISQVQSDPVKPGL